MNPNTWFVSARERPARSRSSRVAGLGLAALMFVGLGSASGQTTSAATPARPADETVVLEEYTVTSVRGSLISAQEIKENAVAFVDSIVAQDIGKFPDNTVADALQRVPGIQVARDNGEVNSVVIRGLPNLGTTLNGEEIFTGTGRGVALQDIPAELVAAVDVYKTSTPEQVEGGIAGLIDIRLRRPLDFKGFEFAAGGRWIFSKYADKDSWVGSALISDRWKLANGGEVGALLSLSGNERNFKDQRVFNFLWEPVAVPAAATGGPTSVWLPFTAGSLITPGDRKRAGYDLSLQFRVNPQLELFADILKTTYRNRHDVNYFIGFPRFGAYQSITLAPGTNVVQKETTVNNFHLNSTQAFDDKTDSWQATVGLKWTVDQLRLSTEGVYNWSSFKPRVVIVDVQYVTPATFTFDLINPTGTNIGISGDAYRDANSYRLWGLFDNHSYQTSHEGVWRGDADYQLKRPGFLTHLKGGLRYTSRNAKSKATTANDIPPAAGRGVVNTASIPGFGSLAPHGVFSKSDFAASNWYAGDANFLRDHPDVIRTAFGLPTSDPNFNPTQGFSNQEETYAGYLQAGYKLGTSEHPVEGLFGARMVHSKGDMTGYLTDATPVNRSTSHWDVLPTINGKLRLMPDLLFRFSLGRTITRPNFADLNPSGSLFPRTTTGGQFGTGSGGNPDLKNVRSDNYDVALEYYFARASYVSVAGFYREIDGYVQTFASLENVAGYDYQFIITRPRNSETGHLDGIEATYQHFPEFLPGWLKGLGWHTNFTYIEGTNHAPDPTSTLNPAPIVSQPYAQVSKYAYNIIAIYERGPFSARLAYNWRDMYVDTFNGPNSPTSGIRTIRVKANDWMDFSASYTFGKNLTVTFDATNLLDQRYHDYFGASSNLYMRDSRRFDRTYELGVRYRY